MNHKITIRGGYGLGNFGDDVLLINLINQISEYYDYSEIVVLCNNAPYLKKMLNKEISIIDFNEVSFSFSTDILIYGGGTQFFSFKKKTLQYRISLLFKRNLGHTLKLLETKFNFGIKKNIYLESKFDIAHNSKSLALIGIGLGPFDNINNNIEEKTKDLFLKADFVSIRDSFAFDKCTSWNISNFNKFPDLCYSHSSNLFNKSVMSLSETKKIGVIVRDWTHELEGRVYIKKILNVVAELRLKKIEVTFISFAKKTDKYWDSLLNKRGENYLFWDPYKSNVDTFLYKLNEFDLFITSRYHGAVYSTLLNKPFISIEVEQKLEMISDLFSKGSFCWHKPFDELELLNYIDLIFKDYCSYVREITHKKNELTKLSSKHFDLFKLYLKKKKNQ